VPQAIIVGSGPAAVGAALALSARADLRITVIDLGLRLETEHQDAIETLSSLAPEQWPAGLVGRVAAQPVTFERSRPAGEARLRV
jgi:thioredoxin reductase